MWKIQRKSEMEDSGDGGKQKWRIAEIEERRDGG